MQTLGTVLEYDTQLTAVSRARQIFPLVKAAAKRIESERRMPADVLAALHETGLFRLLLPRSVGGLEVNFEMYAEALEIIGEADASTGWIVSQAGDCAYACAYLDADVARQLFGRSDAVLAWGAGILGRAVRVDGGYRISGTWPFTSGIRHASLLGAQCYLYAADGTPIYRPDGRQHDRGFLIPRDHAQYEEVWDAVGLKGTGSDTFTVNDLFVPEQQAVDRGNADELREPGPLYKASYMISSGIGKAALMLGIARGIMDDLIDLAMKKTPRLSASSLRDSQSFQTQISTLEVRWSAARALLRETARDTYAAAQRADTLSMNHRARAKLATTFVINSTFDVISEAYRAAGATAIFPSNEFERRMRDAMTVTQQLVGRTANYVTTGRVILGLEPDTPAIL